MPFFNKAYSLGATDASVPIVDFPPGVVLKSLKIAVDGIHAAVVYISSHPDALTTGFPLYASIAYNGVATDPLTGGRIEFNSEELKCLSREEKKLYASANGTACTVHVFGVIEY